MKDTNIILKKLLSRKVKDYSFVIGFFCVFSFFILFAIRPNISTVFTLNRQLEELKQVDSSYENVILHIVELQSKLEENRDNFYLLDQAVPLSPQVNKVVDDIRLSASSSGIILKKLDISQVNLKEDNDKIKSKSYVVNMEIASSYGESMDFIKNLLGQRRLKSIRQLTFSEDSDPAIGSGSGSLNLRLELEGFYL